MSMNTIFAESRELPHLPEVVQALMTSFHDNDVKVDTISQNVARDPSLTAKVLRLANSAHFGLARTVATPQDAVMLLGFSTLRTMVLASGVSGAFRLPQAFDQKKFWRDSFAVAALSGWVSTYVGNSDRDIAFTCGMLHGIGSLLMRVVMPLECGKIDDIEALGGKRYSLESGQWGYNSADVGAELAKRWKFPVQIQQAIEQQNNPDTGQPYSTLAAIIYLAQFLHRAQQENLDEDQIRASFPMAVAGQIQMDIKHAFEDLSSIGDLDPGLDALLT